MEDQQSKLNQLIELVDAFDTFSNLERDMSLFSVAIGTLRKDRSIARDIYLINSTQSDGLGSMALTRILIEDYLHLKFLFQNQDKLDENIANFNAHPNIKNYATLQSMLDWGIPQAEIESQVPVQKVNAGFEEHKARFLRAQTPSEPFNPDDYWRTWTKTTLDKMVKKTGLTDSEAEKRSLMFQTEIYEKSSSVIHHDSFIIWFLATQQNSFFAKNFPGLASTMSVLTLLKSFKLVLDISQPVLDDDELILRFTNSLTDII